MPGSRSLPYDYALENRETLLGVYIREGRKGFSEYLGVSYNGAGHLIKYLGFYDKSVQKERREIEVEEMRKPRCVNPFVPFNKDSAYILGFIVGDGCARKRELNPDYQRVLEWNLNISCNDLQVMREIAVRFGKTEDDLYERVYSEGYKSTYMLDTDDYETIQEVFRLGVRPRKSNEGCIPDFPKEYYSHFLRGLFDADGYVRPISDTRVSVEICGHRSYLERIAENTPFSWKEDYRKKLGFLKLYKKKESLKLFNYLYGDGGIRLDRKWKVFDGCSYRLD